MLSPPSTLTGRLTPPALPLLLLVQFSAQPHPKFIQSELMWTWGFSVVQRFIVNEPLIIISTKLGPKVLRSKLCYACFSERCVEGASAMIFTLINTLRQILALR